MEAILGVLPFIVMLVLVWLVYSNISYAVTIINTKKKDSSMISCLSQSGTYFYIGLVIVYGILLLSSIIFIGILFINNNNDILLFVLNGITIITIGITYIFQQIIFVGQKQMLIGKILLDYRKIKRVTFPKANKLQFVYGQKEYQSSLWFIDESKLRKALHKTK